jgi:hypothetical protein
MRTLVKTASVAVEHHWYRVRYFESQTPRGHRRFSAEILIAPGDRIIIDDDSQMNLETKALRLVPATIYSRLLAGRAA